MVGRCKGRGDIARLTPVIVGSRYGRTSDESFLWVQPNGLMVVTKDSWGVWGSVFGIICYCSSMMPACILSSSWGSAWCCSVM
jgi:hypothetical protein